MARVVFEINDNDLLIIEEAIKGYGDNAEDVINDYLVNEAGDRFKQSITNLIPVSDRNKRNHARNSDPFKVEDANLALVVRTKKQYHYLYFPNEGEGTNKRHAPLLFDERGVEKEYDNVVNGILDRLQNNL